MIESIQFHNFKTLRDTALPLGRVTLIVGPNGSGKSTAARAIQIALRASRAHRATIQSAEPMGDGHVQIELTWSASAGCMQMRSIWPQNGTGTIEFKDSMGRGLNKPDKLRRFLEAYRVYAFEANAIAGNVGLAPGMELAESGAYLAGVIDQLRDADPERWEALNEALGTWFPEFDRILFATPSTGQRALLLRTREGHHPIAAAELSHGTLLALTMLTIAYLPEPPPIVCFEEPDRGIHPRLLMNIRDAIYRLAYPEDHGESREPVQVIATTHSPYFLDLFKDHPEEIVIAEKDGPEARFHRLADRSDLDELLGKASLGEIWYTGILGGVPAAP